MEQEALKQIINAGVSAIFLGFILWRMVPALHAIEVTLTKLTERFAVHSEREEAHMGNLDVRFDAMLNNHMEHLPENVAKLVIADLATTLQRERAAERDAERERNL